MVGGSFRSYGRVDPYLQFRADTKRKERLRIIIIISASAFLILAIVAVSLAILLGGKHSPPSSTSDPDSASSSSSSAAILALCQTAAYPSSCNQSLSTYPGALSISEPTPLVIVSIKVAFQAVSDAYNLSLGFAAQQNVSVETMAFEDCAQLMDLSLDELNRTIEELSGLDVTSFESTFQRVEGWLNTASSDQTACADGLANISTSPARAMLAKQEYVSELIINALSLVEALTKIGPDLSAWKNALPDIDGLHLRRRLLSLGRDHDGRSLSSLQDENGYLHLPHWLSPAARSLLQSSSSSFTPNLVVDIDGTVPGSYASLKAALENVPEDRPEQFIILMKAGVYNEGPLNISKSLTNLTLIGEGCNVTIITGDANVQIKNYTTYRSATVGIAAKGFIAMNLTFRNTAGPEGHQAVAMRSNADEAIFSNCCFEGYQDTLYALSGTQFYKNCRILGTVDFIFGNALAFFQDCELIAREPNSGQQNTYTAQGRKEKQQTTGFTFQNCNLTEGEDLKRSRNNVSTYFGRPWKAYSSTVFLQSNIGGHVSPTGWLSWNDSRPFETTCYYGEYGNTGPGANTSDRVQWECVHPNLTDEEALDFTVGNLFAAGGTQWISSDVSDAKLTL